jgi:hypothetical protein
MEGGKQGSGGRSGQSSVLRGILSVLQWWGFNVLVIIMNKWIFQVCIFCLMLSLSLSSLPSENPLNDLSGIRFDFLSSIQD